MKTQHISSDNNLLIDKCSESTLRNQRFSDLCVLGNSRVWNQPHTEMQIKKKKNRKGKPDSQQRNIYSLPLLYANMTFFVPYFLNFPRIFVTSLKVQKPFVFYKHASLTADALHTCLMDR